MNIRPLSLIDFLTYGAELTQWIEELAEASAGEFTARDVTEVIEKGTHKAWAWCTDKQEVVGVMVSTVAQYNKGKAFVVVGASGAVLDEWEEADAILTQIAKHFECVTVEIKGREGFEKVFKPLGWKRKYVTLEKPVEAS